MSDVLVCMFVESVRLHQNSATVRNPGGIQAGIVPRVQSPDTIWLLFLLARPSRALLELRRSAMLILRLLLRMLCDSLIRLLRVLPNMLDRLIRRLVTVAETASR